MSSGGGGGEPPLSNGGEFLLSLLQRPNHPQQQPPPHQFPYASQQRNQPPSAVDPAVAELGPTILFPHQYLHRQAPWQSSGPDLVASSPWPHQVHRPPFPFQQNPWAPTTSAAAPPKFPGDQSNQQRISPEDLFKLGFPGANSASKQVERGTPKLQFGSIPESQVNALHERRVDSSSRGFERQHQQAVRPPPGFSSKLRGGGARMELDHDVEVKSNGNVFRRGGLGLAEQLDRPGPPAGSKLHSVSASDVEESFVKLRLGGRTVAEEDDGGEEGGGVRESDDVGEELVGSLLMEGDPEDKKDKKEKRNIRDKEFRSDSRGQMILSQRMRMFKCQMRCRSDIDRFCASFLVIYESLIPLEEEQAKQKQLMSLLEKLVNKEWPDARLYLYGSCANSFGVSKSDIDVCLAIGEANIDKSKVLLKLACMLQSDNLENVQALTRARVPIVKLMDPVTGIKCDICINNVLAVVNTKLLRDYAKIDSRLRQLAFIVKHWAKSRAVNETYQGTLSSYAYVLMCIHFLQQRRPAILPCLQAMEATYSVTVDDVRCSFFDQVEQIRGFGSRNRETIAHLVWGFFNYWAYRHDYANDVISVRTGNIISKREKDWTRRVGNDRHLICIEDPFETSHDLGRVVDKFSIRVLREEFERAAKIMQEDADPCVTLFEPYVSS